MVTRRTRLLSEQLAQTAGLEVAVVFGMEGLSVLSKQSILPVTANEFSPHLHLCLCRCTNRRPNQTRQNAHGPSPDHLDQGHLLPTARCLRQRAQAAEKRLLLRVHRMFTNEKGLASLQGLDFPSLFGSPTWARTRDLRINRLPLDLAANPHECSLSGGRASNTSCPFHLRKAWEGVI